MVAVDLHGSFTAEDLQTTSLLAPRGLVLALPGDPISVAKELPQTVDPDVIPLGCLSPGSTLGIKHVAAGLRRLTDWRRFLDIMGASPA